MEVARRCQHDARHDRGRVKGHIARRLIATCAVACLTLGALGSATSTEAQSLDVVNVAVGPGSLTFTPIYLADRLGYFKAEGLDVHFVTIDSAALEVAPLGVGQIDVGGGAISAGLYNAVARGIDVRIVADLGSDPKGYGFDQLVVRKALVTSGAYKSVKDLKGKTFGITGPGISTTALVNALLQTAGLSIADVKIVVMPVSDQIAALKTGAIDASVMPEPGPTEAETAGVLSESGARVHVLRNELHQGAPCRRRPFHARLPARRAAL